ncbi:shikimate dehydrogenase [Rhodobacteraceae bacterium WD3A24]|nr:shikimate dehydrogenase [Rhodobacteraceae bacterium WD3A24]
MSETIPLAGVIGRPIAHSRSPALHAHWLKTYRIAGYYVPLDVGQSDLADVLAMLPRMGFVGVNITIPHKESALHLSNFVSDRAALIGAANTLIFRDDGSIQADNTDGYGFIANLRQNAPQWDATAGPAAVLGAGGAARAVVSALIQEGAPEIRLANRSRARADGLKSDFGGRVQVYEWVRAAEMLDGAATVVNTTSLGMTGKPELGVRLDALGAHATVCDLVYTPLRTGFLQRAEAMGCTTVDGLGMLLHQAAPGFERWFGTRPSVDDSARAAVLGQ